jgi:hypothetical protein
MVRTSSFTPDVQKSIQLMVTANCSAGCIKGCIKVLHIKKNVVFCSCKGTNNSLLTTINFANQLKSPEGLYVDNSRFYLG